MRRPSPLPLLALAAAMLISPLQAAPGSAAQGATTRHNVILFIADGLRYDSITAKNAPRLYRLRREGVDFRNSHSIYPTITTVNASAIATGHYIGDTGNFGNQLYTGFASPEAGGATTPFLENDAILGEMNAHFRGNYLNETSLLAVARENGYLTAALGKTGPTSIQDVTARDGSTTIVIDDAIGTSQGLPIPADIAGAMTAAGLPATAPKTAVPNFDQQKYLLAIATQVVLPKFRQSGKPFVLVFWSRDPDASQHGAKDSLGKVTPGINAATDQAAITNADSTLGGLLDSLSALGLAKSTDVFVTADHGFSTIRKTSETSAAARYAASLAAASAGAPNAASVESGAHVTAPIAPGDQDLPTGFVAIDLADALDLPLTDANTQKPVDFKAGQHPVAGNAYLGSDPRNPEIVTVSNGGSEHLYVFGPNANDRARDIVRVLLDEDYVSGIFADDGLGEIPGTLAMSAVNLRGAAVTPRPSLIVNFRSALVPGCKPILLCTIEVADTTLQTGQGMHGTFSRADTRNFMAAWGPDFKRRFADPAPISNADIAPTLARIIDAPLPYIGRLRGRVVEEAFPRGGRVVVTRGWQRSKPAPNGLATVLEYQQVGATRYFDAAGFPGRTVGLLTH